MNKTPVKDIAEALSMSPSTVSRALNGKGRISEKTKKKIFDYLKENDPESIYLQKTKTNHTVGVIIEFLSIEFFALLIEMLQSQFATKDIDVVLGITQGSQELTNKYVRQYVKNQYDAIIAISLFRSTIDKDELGDIPLIAFDIDPIKEGKCDLLFQSDRYYGAVISTEELIQAGCKKIAYFTNTYLDEVKFKGFKDCLASHHMDFDENLYIASGSFSKNSIEDAKMMTEYLLGKQYEFDGIVATSDRRALGAIIALQMYGKTFDDIKVVGYDYSTLAQSFKITSISQDIEAITTNIFLAVMSYIDPDAYQQPIKKLFPVSLIRGQTT